MANFEGGVNTGHPLPGNMLAMVYKGGPIVPVLLGLLLMVVVFSFERYAVISKVLVQETLINS
jgi:biopolymer transport protein ExbB